jgi:hypothetical protein
LSRRRHFVADIFNEGGQALYDILEFVFQALISVWKPKTSWLQGPFASPKTTFSVNNTSWKWRVEGQSDSCFMERSDFS